MFFRDEQAIFVYGSAAYLCGREDIYSGIDALQDIKKNQLISRLYVKYINQNLFYTQYGDAMNSTLIIIDDVFDTDYVLVYRHPLFFENNKANFIRSAEGNEIPNCSVVYGNEVGHFKACVFLKALRDIREGEELLLDDFGISSAEAIVLKERFAEALLFEKTKAQRAERTVDLADNKNVTEDWINEFNSDLRAKYDNDPGIHLELGSNKPNTNFVNALLGLGDASHIQLLSEDYLIERLKQDRITFALTLNFDSEATYHDTSGNGMCFQTSYYQSMKISEDPDQYKTIDRWPLCEDYISVFARASAMRNLHEVLVKGTEKEMLAEAISSVDHNLKKLCNKIPSGYTFGNFFSMNYAQEIFPIDKTPRQMFILFSNSGSKFRHVMTGSFLHPIHPYFSPTFEEIAWLSLSYKNVVFFKNIHYWIPKYDDMVPFLAEEALKTFAHYFKIALIELKSKQQSADELSKSGEI